VLRRGNLLLRAILAELMGTFLNGFAPRREALPDGRTPDLEGGKL